MKSAFLSLMMVPAIALMAQPSNSNSAGDPIATVQSGPWTEASTWDCGCVPSPSNDVTVLGSHTVTLNAGDTARAESLSMAAGSAMMLPAQARVELASSLASLGEIEGIGVVAFVGGGSQTCGPAKLGHLACGSGEVNFADTVTVTRQLDLEDATLETGGMLVLQGKSGLTTDAGTITGQVHRRYTWEKTSPYTYQVGTGLDGVMAEQLLDVTGTVYLKQWLEPSTSYLSLVESDVLPLGAGFTSSLPAGSHDFSLAGEAVTEREVTLTADANGTWQGWNLVCNPLASFVDVNAVAVSGPGSFGATYQWDDSLLTYVAQIGGLGLFGNSGILEPGAAFWTIADTTTVLGFGADAMVSKANWETQSENLTPEVLGFQLQTEERKEQCLFEFGAGSDHYDRMEDAAFVPAGFRGRNNLDIFSKSADDVSLVINRTSQDAQVIPLWVKAMNGDSVTISTTAVPENMCLILEDLLTGWTASVEPGLQYTYYVNSNSDEHRFNLTMGGNVSAVASEAACESAMDGAIAVVAQAQTIGLELYDDEGQAAGIFSPDSLGGTFSGLGVGVYTVTAITEGCADLNRTVEVVANSAGGASFDIQAMPDHIGCYDDHGGVSLDIDGGLAPYTVAWSHGAVGDVIEVEAAGVLEAVITDAAGCSDSTSVEVLSAPQVEAGIALEAAVVTLVDGEAEVYFENASSGATAYQWNFGDGNASAAENPIHAYTTAGAYTVGLNAWNDYCSDTYQMVVTVETVSSVGDFAGSVEAAIERTSLGWQVRHPQEAFNVEVFDLTGRMVYMASGMPGSPVVLDPAVMPAVALVLWKGAQSGHQQTWRLAR